MSDFAPPSGPPPPKAPEVPSGWTARWNDQYKEWFYVNLYTKKSQWDKPTHPVYPEGEAPPSDPPPGYDGHGRNSPYPSDHKTNPYSNSGNNAGSSSRSHQEDEDARMAARLQAEENARAHGGGYSGGAVDSYRQGQSTSPYPPPGSSPYASPPPQQQQGQSGDRGLLSSLAGGFIGSKLGSKNSNSHNASPSGFPGAPGAGPYGNYGPPPPQGYGPPPPQGYGPPGYGGTPGAYGGGYGPPPQQYAPSPQPMVVQQQAPPRKSGGLGGFGGAALGLGAGVVGTLLVEDAIDHFEDKGYEQGYDQGYDNGFDNGYDDGGGDW